MKFQESQNLELKSSLGEWKEIIKTLSAFANQKGGKIIIGVDEDGELSENVIGKSSIEDIANKIKNNTDPVLYPLINQKTYGPQDILEIEIAQSDYKPVFAFGRAYIRVGKTNQKISNQELRNLIKKYHLIDWDKQVMNVGFKNVVDSELIKKIALEHFNKKIKNTTDEKKFLKQTNLIINNKITNAGYLLFAKEINLMDNAGIKAARFKGNKMVDFIDVKEFNQNIIVAVNETLDFIKKHTNKAYVITGKPARDEVWDYPIKALREAIVNAICHRDYQETGEVEIRIFDDKLEIWSPGLLPRKITIQNLLIENRSVPRNKLIAKIFKNIDYIEGWGTGFQRIIEACKKNGNKAPVFSEKVGAFVIDFYKKSDKDLKGGIKGGINGGING
ncbi:putative DNA binding domain-containing protein, partial [Patescibacteria group bacterium]|nr:putative DNA binding domain-containing protein [Patescibacteria group bacterium]